MKIRYFIFLFIFTAIIIILINIAKEKELEKINNSFRINLNKILKEEKKEFLEESNFINHNSLKLYSKAACVYDCYGKRNLYSLNSKTKLPMASTTKIMTCIIALESDLLEMDVIFSKYAASMPNVQLHANEGEKFKLKDILYSLMLESHNDSAVAIAENIAGKVYNIDIDIKDVEKSKFLVKKFAELMNKKANEIGTNNTNFITPNGLDANEHYTTADDLVKIGAYAIDNKMFLDITNTKYYSLTSTEGKNYNLHNKNNFLSMYKGAIGCKTGYTSKAGYCFVGAVKRDNYKLVSVVLASGWPPNKGYKWNDTKKLMDCAIDNYKMNALKINNDTLKIKDMNVISGTKKKIHLYINEKINMLLNSKDKIKYKIILPNKVCAPIDKKEVIGLCKVYLNDRLYKVYNIYSQECVEKIHYKMYFKNILDKFIGIKEFNIAKIN